MKPIYDVSLKTCHDIRHWIPCDRCKGIGDDRRMVRVDGGSNYHRICFKRRFGIDAVIRLPAKVRDGFTIADLGALGMRKLLAKIFPAKGVHSAR